MYARESTIRRYTQNYVQAIFAERLRQEGFVTSKKYEYLSWIRLRNNQIIHTVTIYTNYRNSLPVDLSIFYGIHPLFIEPVSVRYKFNGFLYATHETGKTLKSPVNSRGEIVYNIHSPELPVYTGLTAGTNEPKALDLLFPQMEGMNTVEDCYQKHKHFYRDRCGSYATASVHFFDEAIYVNDPDMYLPAFLEGMENMCKWVGYLGGRYKEKHPVRKLSDEWLRRFDWQRRIFSTGEAELRKEYLAILEQRKQTILEQIREEYGV